MMNDIFYVINQLTPQELENAGMLTPARKTGWVCPFCGNGTGENGTGLSLVPNTNLLKCFVCNESFPMFDLIAAHEGFDAKTKAGRIATIEFAKEKFNLSTDFATFTEKNAVAQDVKIPQEKTTDYSGSYEKWRKNLEGFIESRGGNYRGLPLKLLQAHGAGYDAGWLILPYDNFHYFKRAVNQQNIESPKQHRGKKGIYNVKAIRLDAPNFIVEGEIDCLSVELAGFTAIATGGAAECNTILAGLNKIYNSATRKPSFIVMFDNNDSGAGQKGAERLVKELSAAGYPAINAILDSENQRDSNEFLQTDFEGFKARLTEIHNQGKREIAKIEGVEILADIFDDLDSLSIALKENLLKWGFDTLDAKLPMLPGCYLLGALPSLGKTTFALNVATNICDQGEKILYVSFEPTVRQLAAKDLASYWFKEAWDGKSGYGLPQFLPTASQILLGSYSSEHYENIMREVREKLKGKRRNFYFLQGRNNTAKDLVRKIKNFVDGGVKFIVVDYIQLIRTEDKSKPAREQIDETIRELQMFQSENNLIMLFISSFNRENYRSYACLESFKESGNLEYTADAVMALQFEYSKGESRANIEKFQEKKQSQPRIMELVCLKNRFGTDFKVRFTYHSANETFVEKPADTDTSTNAETDYD